VFRRLDRAAAALNPILTLLAIGLAVIDLIGLCSVLDQKYANAVSWTCSSPRAARSPLGGSDGY
jgi:hypothetical protein